MTATCKLKGPPNSQIFRDLFLEALDKKLEDIMTFNMEENLRFLWDNLSRATCLICG